MSTPINPNNALWEKGDFTRIAQSMRRSGEALVATLGITPGLEVLDLGCGDGTTAVPEARLGADVLGVDIARNLVEAGARRANEAAAKAGRADDLHRELEALFISQNQSANPATTTGMSRSMLKIAERRCLC